MELPDHISEQTYFWNKGFLSKMIKTLALSPSTLSVMAGIAVPQKSE